MKLWYGPPSPFSRKVRVAIIEYGIAERVVLIPVVTTGDTPELAALNPLMKVPTLVTDDGRVLYDSRVICEYLETLRSDDRLISFSEGERLRVLCRQALGDGLMEALIFLRVAARRPQGEDTPSAITERQRARVERCLDVLERQADEMKDEGASIGCITVGCAIGWQDFNFAGWDWRATRPHLASWYEFFSRRRSMLDTAPVRLTK
jgi:glutathione S-transferase